MDITDFFNINTAIVHNAASKDIPDEFRLWETSPNICKNFFDWIRNSSDTGSLKLDITSDISEVVEELSRAEFLAIPHRSDNSNGWRSIVLHGLCSIMTEAPYNYVNLGIVDKSVKETWTDASKFFPKTLAWIDQYVPFKTFSRIRIMVLDPGGYILPHKDLQQSFLGGGLNIAFTNPEGTEFAVEDNGLIPWEPGDIRMINIGKLHSIRNLGSKPRIHMLAYPPLMEEWTLDSMKLVCRSYENMKKDKHTND